MVYFVVKGCCLSEEDIQDFIDRETPLAKVDSVCRHIERCPSCADKFGSCFLTMDILDEIAGGDKYTSGVAHLVEYYEGVLGFFEGEEFSSLVAVQGAFMIKFVLRQLKEMERLEEDAQVVLGIMIGISLGEMVLTRGALEKIVFVLKKYVEMAG